MTIADFDKQVNYLGYESSGEFSVHYSYKNPLPVQVGDHQIYQHSSSKLTSTTKFYTMPDLKSSNSAESRVRTQVIDTSIVDPGMESGTAKRTVKIQYDEDWNLETVEFSGQFTDEHGKVHTFSMQLDEKLQQDTSVFSPSGVMAFVDGYAQNNPNNTVGNDTWDRVQQDIYSFCKEAYQEARAMKDDRGASVMDVQLGQLRDYEQMIEMGRRRVEKKHATEALGYEGKDLSSQQIS